ncbi:MAG: DUF1761 domain-containing protein [Rhizobiales bacterium]|nr:DUF1761 domain-containing protein [Hyphomicrobiales bacterium]
MILYGVNVVAVVVAAIAAWFFGAAYYTPLGKIWLKAQGKTAAQVKRAGKSGLAKATPFILSFIAELVMASILAALIIRAGAVTIKSGLAWGALMWFGFMLTTMTTNYAFADRKPMLTLIDAGHWLGVMLIMGAIIGAFGF